MIRYADRRTVLVSLAGGPTTLGAHERRQPDPSPGRLFAVTGVDHAASHKNGDTRRQLAHGRWSTHRPARTRATPAVGMV